MTTGAPQGLLEGSMMSCSNQASICLSMTSYLAGEEAYIGRLICSAPSFVQMQMLAR